MKKRLPGIIITVLILVLFVPATLTVASAETSGLQVAYHSPAEICAFLRNHPSSVKDRVHFAVEPSLMAPYSIGTLSSETAVSALNMLNQIRYLAGLSSDIYDDASLQEQEADTSLLQYLAVILNHYPERPAALADSSYDDLYNLGYRGSGSSNLAAGYSNLNDAMLYGWMADEDSGNITRVGHRRWVLNPRMTRTAFGVAGRYYSMYAVDNRGSIGQYGVSWPAQEMPIDYFKEDFPWSVSIGTTLPEDDIHVTLLRQSDGRTWSFSNDSADGAFYVNNSGYGQAGCIIFRPNDLERLNAGDRFTVTITGLPDKVSSLKLGTTLSYEVHFFSEQLQVSFDTCVDGDTLESVELPVGGQYGTLPAPASRAGYTFTGWYTAPQGGEHILPTTTVTATESQTLYAYWKQNGEAPRIETTALPDGTQGAAYSFGLSADIGSISWSAQTLPEGLSLNSETGVLSGTPVAAGNYDLLITATANADSTSIGSTSVTLPLHISDSAPVTPQPDNGLSNETPSGSGSLLNTSARVQYISGYSDGTFRPNNSISRAEVAMIFYRLLIDQGIGHTATFTDVPQNAWYAEAIQALADLKLFTGYSDGSFHPNDPITRAEFVTVASRFMPLTTGTINFSDVSESHWAYAYILSGTAKGWVSGYPDGTFHPSGNITRGEAVKIINRMVARTESTETSNDFSDLSASYWGYTEIMAALH